MHVALTEAFSCLAWPLTGCPIVTATIDERDGTPVVASASTEAAVFITREVDAAASNAVTRLESVEPSPSDFLVFSFKKGQKLQEQPRLLRPMFNIKLFEADYRPIY